MDGVGKVGVRRAGRRSIGQAAPFDYEARGISSVNAMTEVGGSGETARAEAAGGGPAPSLWTRLWFAWFCVVAVVVTVPFSLVQVVTHQFAPTARNFKRWATGWGRLVLRLSGIRVVVRAHEALDPARPYVFVANHQNLLDILALADGLSHTYGFLAKAELARVPFLGFALRNSASLFIDRSDPRRSIESMRRVGDQIRNGCSVLIYPEGARSYGRTPGALKKGAFAVGIEAGVPLVPVTVVDAYRLMDERRKTARPGTIHVVVGTPIPMENRRRQEIPEIMEAVRRQYEAALAP